jgi:hypothetical protein
MQLFEQVIRVLLHMSQDLTASQWADRLDVDAETIVSVCRTLKIKTADMP